ncbi:hypothetical protein BD626DRAFT_444655 [Schizophyllum amplum]|uniref:Uncharacterized protein n=1 Tax=Schizophyllum amplum TaxID=97359 RepID=A0A550BS15_9AGAR|nr:hypothetical protein BD626DRAFT_444655 [Auriculariopsis ampla]
MFPPSTRGTKSVLRANARYLPCTRLEPYPLPRPISEVWQAERWKKFKPEERTPMYARDHKRFFIEELCQLYDGTYVIPHDWVVRKGCLTARSSVVQPTPAGLWAVTEVKENFQADTFQYTYEDLVARIGTVPDWEVSNTIPAPPAMPNPLRELAPDCDLYVVMVPLWADDVSGNKSKQYNKHMNTYMANSNLPGRLLQQEYFVRFVSTSPHASSPEQFAAVRDQINATHQKPIHCFNAQTQRECAVILRVPGLPADNPQQSEEASHIGGNGLCPCRKCTLGGPVPAKQIPFKQTTEGYHTYHYAGIARSASEIREELRRQLDTAMLGVDATVKQMQTASGTKDKVTQHWIGLLLSKASDMKKADPQRSPDDIVTELRVWLDGQPGDKMNPLLDIAGLDPSQDTPVEILHTILLGVMKYAWYILHTSWTEQERQLFTIRLQSTDIDGLSIAPIRAGYMMQYRNNLIGKDFKALMQTVPFHLHDISEQSDKHPERFTLLKAIGELGAMLWAHTIDNMDQFLSDIEILTANVLDTFDVVDCKKITTKIKLHLLPHLVEDIRRFGPAIRNSTEVFECFNAVFRLCSVLSNHQAPSRDIAVKLSSFDRVKHIVSGGYWKENGKWVQASTQVQDILHQKPVIQRHLGWTPARPNRAGKVTQEAKRVPPRLWSDTFSGSATSPTTIQAHTTDSRWRSGKSLVAQSGDVCRCGSWVFARTIQTTTVTGRIKEILVASGSTADHEQSIVLLEVFHLGQARHVAFGAPVLGRPAVQDDRYMLLTPKDVLFIFSAQHDCRTFGCKSFVQVTEVQEHQKTDRQRSLLKHEDDDHFIVNIYAIHNAVELRRAISRELMKPIPLFADRRAHHDANAYKLREKEVGRRAMLAQRRAEKKAAKEAEAQKARLEANTTGAVASVGATVIPGAVATAGREDAAGGANDTGVADVAGGDEMEVETEEETEEEEMEEGDTEEEETEEEDEMEMDEDEMEDTHDLVTTGHASRKRKRRRLRK